MSYFCFYHDIESEIRKNACVFPSKKCSHLFTKMALKKMTHTAKQVKTKFKKYLPQIIEKKK